MQQIQSIINGLGLGAGGAAGGHIFATEAISAVIACMLGGASSAYLAPRIRELAAEFVKESGLTGSAAEFMTNTVTGSILQGIGGVTGGTGAAYAGNTYQNNFLNHKQLDDLKQASVDCGAQRDIESCKANVSQQFSNLDFKQEKQLDSCRTINCVQSILGDLCGDPHVSYSQVMELQELGLDEPLGQRLLAYQVQERWLTGDASLFEQRVMDVAAGAGYCEDRGGSNGCFIIGQARRYVSESVTAIAYGLIGAAQLRPAKVGTAAGEATGPKLQPFATRILITRQSLTI